MVMIINNNLMVTCCGECPYIKAESTFDYYDEGQYICIAHPYEKCSDLNVMPEWCPLRNNHIKE